MTLSQLAATIVLSALSLASAPPPYHVGQSVYVVVADITTRDATAWKPDLVLTRKVEGDFTSDGRLRISRSLATADLVFVVALDPESKDSDEIAIAVSPADFRAHEHDLDALRDAATWTDNHHNNGRANAALAGGTFGLSAIFHRPSSSKALVKEFLGEAVAK